MLINAKNAISEMLEKTGRKRLIITENTTGLGAVVRIKSIVIGTGRRSPENTKHI